MYHRRVAEFRVERVETAEKEPRLVQRAIERPIGRSSDGGADSKSLFANLLCRTVTVYLTR